MRGDELVGKTVYVKSGANDFLKKQGFFMEEMCGYEGKVGVVKQFLNIGDTPNTNHIVEFPDGVEWSYPEEFLAEVKVSLQQSIEDRLKSWKALLEDTYKQKEAFKDADWYKEFLKQCKSTDEKFLQIVIRQNKL